MGVPRFFKRVSERYPHVSVDLTSAVAPGLDNLYIDMNGVVHNCARGSAMPGEADGTRYMVTSTGPRSYADIFLGVFKYLDNLFALVRPRRLVYFALDGVAPRAKMNQQRSRRFRSARERADEHEQKLRENPLYKVVNQTPFDSNCITPGTVFMAQLTQALEYFVHKRMSEDAAWARVEVILSGSEAPGEGEHKVMEYIRQMKISGLMQANTRHCVYGLDADLIMLGLVTHEPHFMLLREKIDYSVYYRRKSSTRPKSVLDTVSFGEFQLFSIGLLREYLVLDIGSHGIKDLPFFDIERVVDDFVFIAMLVGNDFLPHLPTVEMADGALNTLLLLYKRLLPRFGGYLTDQGRIDPKRFEVFALMLGTLEGDVLVRTARNSGRNGRMRDKITAKSDADYDRAWGFDQSEAISSVWSEERIDEELVRLRISIASNSKLVALKRNYYLSKLKFDTATEDGAAKLRKLAGSYWAGCCWTLKYYCEGCADWRWFYDAHYAPMASDLVELTELDASVKFTRGEPFKPMEQLLSVLPPSSSWCLPKPFSRLMTAASSPIKGMYPTDFQQDLNGKRNDWEAVVLLPFIDETVLLNAVHAIPPDALTPEERVRNTLGVSKVFRVRSGVDEASGTVSVRSPFPGRLPDLRSNVCVRPLELPTIPDGAAFPPTWVEGTYEAGRYASVADLPTFGVVPLRARLGKYSVKVFDRSSKHESLLITLGVGRFGADDDDVALIEGFDSDAEEDFGVDDDTDASSDSLPPHTRSATAYIGGSVPTPDTFQLGIPDEVVPAHWDSASAAHDAGYGVGQVVWAGYPWRVAGIVEGVVDDQETVQLVRHADGNTVSVTSATNDKAFANEVADMSAALSEGRAVNIEEPRVIFHVRVAMEKDPLTGVPTRVASTQSSFLAASIVKMEDADLGGVKSCILQQLEDRDSMLPNLRVGETVISVAKNPLCGCMARVTSLSGATSNPMVGLAFSVRRSYSKEPSFGLGVIAKMETAETWLPNGRVASIVKLPPFVLGSVTGSIRVKPPDSTEEVDIGLGIKYASRGLYIPGYAKVGLQGQFLLSQATVDLIRAYKANFPDMFLRLVAALEQNKGGGNSGAPRVFAARELFGSKNSGDKLTAAASWVGTRELARLPLVSKDARVLTKKTIAELEKEARISKIMHEEANAHGLGYKAPAIAHVPRVMVACGRESIGQLRSMAASGAAPCVDPDASDVQVGYRVVNVSATGPVPLGLRGTVVGVHPRRRADVNGAQAGGRQNGSMSEQAEGRGDRSDGSSSGGGGSGIGGRRKGGTVSVELVNVSQLDQEAVVEVVFDEGFIGGGDLNGRCSGGRGKAMRPESLLRLLPQENEYYARHRNRIAAALRKTQTAEDIVRMEAAKEHRTRSIMAEAAVRSYAEAVRSADAKTRSSIAESDASALEALGPNGKGVVGLSWDEADGVGDGGSSGGGDSGSRSPAGPSGSSGTTPVVPSGATLPLPRFVARGRGASRSGWRGGGRGERGGRGRKVPLTADGEVVAVSPTCGRRVHLTADGAMVALPPTRGRRVPLTADSEVVAVSPTPRHGVPADVAVSPLQTVSVSAPQTPSNRARRLGVEQALKQMLRLSPTPEQHAGALPTQAAASTSRPQPAAARVAAHEDGVQEEVGVDEMQRLWRQLRK